VLSTHWPDMEDEPEKVVAKSNPEVIARLREHTSNMTDFFYGKKEYRKKKFLGITL
jgi:hypothetical protein